MGLEILERAQTLIKEGRFAAAGRLARRAPAGPEKAFLQAEAWRGQGYFTKAEPLYRAALRQFPAQDPLWLESLLGLVRALRSLGRVPEARALLSRARARWSSAYGRDIRLEHAMLDRAEGLYADSLRRLKLILDGYRNERDWSGAAFILWAMAGARRFSGDLRGAKKDFLASLGLARKGGDRDGQVYAWLGLGGIRRILGEPEASRQAYGQALTAIKNSEDSFAVAYAHCGYANALRQLGRLKEARPYYAISGRLYRALGDEADGAYVDWGLGKIALAEGRLQEARALLNRGLKSFSRFKETRGEALSELALASLSYAQGRVVEGEALFARAVKRAKKAGMHTHLEVFT